MKSEREETVTVLEGLETLANPTGLSLRESDDPLDEPDELDEPEDEEPDDDEPKKPLFLPSVSTSHDFESAENFPPVVTLRFKMTFLLAYSADFTELEKRLESVKLFEKIYMLPEKRDMDFPGLMKYKENHGNILIHTINRIIYTKKLALLMNGIKLFMMNA